MLFLLEARTSGLADTRAVLGSSYIPEILRNCLGFVVPSCKWCHTTAAELPQHPQISLLEGIRKPFLVCWREAGLERETSASNQKMAQCNCCMNLDHRRASSEEEWRVAERRAGWPGIFQRVHGGSQVIASVLLVTHPYSWGLLVLLKMHPRQLHSPLPSPHVFVCTGEDTAHSSCMNSMGLHPLQLA